MDVALEKRQVERAYELLAPVYDFVFDWIFAPGRTAAIESSRSSGATPSSRSASAPA